MVFGTCNVVLVAVGGVMIIHCSGIEVSSV